MFYASHTHSSQNCTLNITPRAQLSTGPRGAGQGRTSHPSLVGNGDEYKSDEGILSIGTWIENGWTALGMTTKTWQFALSAREIIEKEENRRLP